MSTIISSFLCDVMGPNNNHCYVVVRDVSARLPVKDTLVQSECETAMGLMHVSVRDRMEL